MDDFVRSPSRSPLSCSNAIAVTLSFILLTAAIDLALMIDSLFREMQSLDHLALRFVTVA